MKITFKDFCDKIVDINVRGVKNSTNQTLFSIVTFKDGESTIHPFFYTDGSPMDYAQQIIDKHTPEMYCIVSEAWVKIIPIKQSSEYEKNYKWGDMKDDPTKKECLFFLGKTMDGTQTYSRTFIINRKKSEITLEELKEPGGGGLSLKSTKLK